MRKITLLLALVCLALNVTADALDDVLRALPGVTRVETLESADGVAKRLVMFEQPIDPLDDAVGTFEQRLVVRHRGFDRPTVIVTEGYGNEYALHPRYTEELSELLEANVIMTEHRFNGASSPVTQRGLTGSETYASTLWEYLTVKNSAYDYHHIRTTFGKKYTGKWFSTGISKGGQTALFYRVFFPDDVVANVSYVAPLNKALEDGRHEVFLDKVGTAEAREKILSYQRMTLSRKAELLPMLESYVAAKGYSFRVPLEEVFDLMVLEYPFAYWQWGDSEATVPETRPKMVPKAKKRFGKPDFDMVEPEVTNDELFQSLLAKCEPNYFARETPYVPFNVQAMREIGYYGYDVKPFKGLLSRPSYEGYMRRVMIPEELSNLEFKGDLYEQCCRFLRERDIPAMFIYGEWDPWSATRVVLPSPKKQMHVFIQPEGSHRARINNMPDAMREDILSILNDWVK